MRAPQPVRGVLLVHLESPLLAGGHAAAPLFLDARSAEQVQRSDLGILPASALRGALREAVVRLERAANRPACTVDAPCEGSEPCLACRLFGAPGPDRPGVTDGTPEALPQTEAGLAGRLVVQDAEDRGGRRHNWSVRPGVGVDRATRSAVPEVLYHREVLDEAGTTLVARVEGIVASEDLERLREALVLVRGVGNSKSRGLGAVRVEWADGDGGVRDAPPAPATVPVGVSTVSVVVTPCSPLVLGGFPGAGSTIRTRSHIPGSTLRGALAAAAVRAGVDPAGEAFQRTFVRRESAVRFGDALPVRSGRGEPLPTPHTLLHCKHANRQDHGGTSTELDSLLLLAVAAGSLLEHGHVWEPSCPVCGRSLQAARGSVWPPASVTNRVVTRLARDVHTGSALPGMLYSTVQVEPDPKLSFVGLARGLDDTAGEVLERAAAGDLWVGKGRSRGLGRVQVAFRASVEDAPGRLTFRRERFEAAAEAVLAAAAATLGNAAWASVGDLVAVVATTDLCVPPERAPDLILESLFGQRSSGARVLSSRQGWGEHSGWDMGFEGGRPGPRPLRPTVRAGSAWLVAAAPGTRPDDAHLARAEDEGVGDRRELGLGQIRLYPDVFLKGLEP